MAEGQVNEETKDVIAVKEAEQQQSQETALTTVINDALALKHPLQNSWQLWYYRNEKGRNWEENLIKVTQFNTVEDFWAVYNHIELASSLAIGCDYCIFKEGIKPMWEDDKNRKGGRWLFQLHKNKQTKVVDELWLEVLLCLIGEAFGEDSDQICGAVVNIRGKLDKISIWTGDSRARDGVMNIGKVLKSRTGYPQQINYEAHADTQSKSSSSAKHIYQL